MLNCYNVTHYIQKSEQRIVENTPEKIYENLRGIDIATREKVNQKSTKSKINVRFEDNIYCPTKPKKRRFDSVLTKFDF